MVSHAVLLGIFFERETVIELCAPHAIGLSYGEQSHYGAAAGRRTGSSNSPSPKMNANILRLHVAEINA